jgi:agmatine/peptidylarginine deiminase
LKYLLTYLLFITPLFSSDSNSVELPIGLTEEEKGRMHIIKEMGRETDPPPTPIRNIAEFERMQGVLIRYPFGISTSIIKEMAEGVVVYCLVSSGSQNSAYNSMNSAGVDMNNVEFITGSTDSYWTRDYGPWWVVDGNRDISVVDFTYNRPRPNDNQAPSKMANYLNTPYFASDIVTAGGNYMTDSYGISASSDLIFLENSMSDAQVLATFEEYYGVHTYHAIDDPNNTYIDHIDCWGKYLSPHKVLIREVPTWHAQYEQIEEVADYFSNTMTIYGEPWEVYRVYTGSNQPYTNSLILNNKVFVPIENNSYDDDALAVYEEALPGFEILGFTGSWQSTDALHCRAKGIPDLEMLQIFHNPIDDQNEAQDNYMVDVIIDDLSEAGLIDEELKVFWWTDDMDMNESESITMTVCLQDIPDCYTASIPGQSEDTIIRYYIQALDNTGKLATLPMAGYYSFQAIGGMVYADGDLNMDGTVNILDIVSMVNVVLNGEQNSMADLNNDGVVNILDIILLVNIILG